MFEDEERIEELKSVREEASKLDREEGSRKRPAITMMACVVLAWAVLVLAGIATGRSLSAITALMLAAFAGLCWGDYRETHQVSSGRTAVIAGLVTVALVVLYIMGF